MGWVTSGAGRRQQVQVKRTYAEVTSMQTGVGEGQLG